MNVLTDTHTLVWALSAPDLLGVGVREALAKYPFTASVANLWELIVKAGKPGALLAEPVGWWEKYVERSQIPVLAIRSSHVLAMAALPAWHRDPFDRILLGQAVEEGFTLATMDSQLLRYGVATVWD